MENQFMHRVSSLFPPSLSSSCQFRNVSDVIENSTIPTRKTNHPFSPKPQKTHPYLIKKPNKPDDNHIFRKKPRTVSKSKTLGVSKSKVTPISPLNYLNRENGKLINMKNSSSSNYTGWFSSEEEEEEAEGDHKSEKFFSLSSGTSSEFFRRETTTARRIIGQVLPEARDQYRDFAVSRQKTIATEQKTSKTGPKTCKSSVSSNNPLSDSVTSHRKTSKNYYQPSKTNRKTSKNSRRNKINQTHFALENVELPKTPTHFYYSDSESSDCQKTTIAVRRTSKAGRRRRRRGAKMGELSFVLDGRVEESYAVEKSSCDPYSDFRASMVEMIVEKQIFGAKDLEKLLECFLYLNLSCYHGVIVEVFYEVCETLFSN